MAGAAGSFVKFLLVASIILSFIMAAVVSFVLLINLMVTLFVLTAQQSVIADTFALINIWLPFNLAPIWAWLTAASFAFLVYRLALIAYTWVNRFLGVTNNG